MQHHQRYLWLDFVRGLCAVAVCAGHLRSMMLVDHARLASSNLPQKALYLATGLGHQAVMVFFVLSGFFVGGAVLRSAGAFRWEKYAVDRLSRLWVVLIPALLLTALLDLSLPASVLAGQYSTLWNSGPGAPGNAYSGTPLTFVGNLLFLQTIFTPVFGSNAPLWSLANEFWYYVMFPLHAHAAGLMGAQGAAPSRAQPWRRLACGAAGTAICLGLSPSIREGYAIWLLGALAYYLSTRLPRGWSAPLIPAGLLAMAGALYGTRSSGLAIWSERTGLSSDLLVGLGFFVLCLGLVTRKPPPPAARALRRLGQALCIRLSDISYSLYLVHFPVVIWIGAFFYSQGKLKPDPAGLLQFGGCLALLLCLGWLFWHTFERRTPIVRSFVLRRLLPSWA